MQQIKVRAWDGKEFLPLAREVAFIDDEGYLRSRVQEIIFNVFTGLKDKNGKEIYDGDIVEISNIYSEKHRASVLWGKVSPMYTWMNGETWLLHFVNKEEGPLFPYCDRHNGFEVEIIGNIYENIELLQ